VGEGSKNLVSHTTEDHRLMVLKNRVLKKIFWPKRQEAAGDLKKLHNEELQ
jgi:preprotein translocase subunit SecE